MEEIAVDLLKVDYEYVAMDGSKVQLQEPSILGSVAKVHYRLRPTASPDENTRREGEFA